MASEKLVTLPLQGKTLRVKITVAQRNAEYYLHVTFDDIFGASFTVANATKLLYRLHAAMSEIHAHHAALLPMRVTPKPVEGNPLKGEKRDVG